MLKSYRYISVLRHYAKEIKWLLDWNANWKFDATASVHQCETMCASWTGAQILQNIIKYAILVGMLDCQKK